MSDSLDPAQYESHGVDRSEGDRIKERFLTALTRGATAGCLLRGGLSSLGALLSMWSAKKRTSTRHPLAEVVRMTLFLGSLCGIYVMVDEAIATVFGKKRTSSWRGFVAGLCAGPSLLFLGRRVRHNSLALYIFVRSVTLLIRCGNHLDRRHVLFSLLKPTRMKHGDVLLMCLSGVQIIYSYIMMPHTMSKSYRHFLARHTGREPYVWHTLKEMTMHEKCRRGESVDRFVGLQGTRHLPFYSAIPCPLLHPTTSCFENAVRILFQSYIRALSVYLPVYLTPAVLVHRRKLLENARSVLPKVLYGILRSSFFLASYIALVYSGTCAVHNVAGMTNPWTLAAGMTIGGIALLAEKKSRRMELSLYAVSRAAESFAASLVEWGYVKQMNKRIDVILFSLSVAIITHCYSDDEGGHRHAFRRKYLNVLDFVFGNSGIRSGTVHHVPSNQELIEMGTRWWPTQWLSQLLRSWWT